jgi:hypothetical protein
MFLFCIKLQKAGIRQNKLRLRSTVVFHVGARGIGGLMIGEAP